MNEVAENEVAENAVAENEVDVPEECLLDDFDSWLNNNVDTTSHLEVFRQEFESGDFDRMVNWLKAAYNLGDENGFSRGYESGFIQGSKQGKN